MRCAWRLARDLDWELVPEIRSPALEAIYGNRVAAVLGHAGPVTATAFSPDGRRIVTASDDNTARVWDVSRTAVIVRDHPVSLAAALLEKLGPERAAQVPVVAESLRAPLHPDCYLSPTQFAEKFGKVAHEMPESHEREEEEEGDEEEGGDPGGEEVCVSAGTSAELDFAPSPPGNSEIQNPKFRIHRGLRPLPVLLLLALVALVSVLATLVVTRQIELTATVDQLRRLLRL